MLLLTLFLLTLCPVETGHMSSELFSDYVHWFARQVKRRPQLLLVDGHATRFQPDLLEWCANEGIHLLCGPPNATAWTQVPDASVFGELKVNRLILFFVAHLFIPL